MQVRVKALNDTFAYSRFVNAGVNASRAARDLLDVNKNEVTG